MPIRLLTHALNVQSDVVGARQRARQVAELLGFDHREQTRISTSVSEIARNAFRYAGGGRVEIEIEGETAPQLLVIRVSDDGPGIAHLDEVLDGSYQSSTGMGIGLIGSRRLMDRWDIHSVPGRGTTVTLGKLLPGGAPFVSPMTAGKLVSRLAAMPYATSLGEMQSQNAELLAALAELHEKQEKLLQMARELEDTNRGVVALYAELDEKAMHLRRADEMKSRFLSNMSHEFRTPLNSVRALCSLLLSKADGALAPEQETQVRFISKAVEDLSELVNDLLDLAKIEAGKIEVRPARFEAVELFSALRGMLKPLLVAESVDLVFDAAMTVPTMHTDESKVSQILRNFVSNALKFTEQGSVTVQARHDEARDAVVFSVRDTGIGIAPEDQQIIFEEFTQIPNPLQRKVKGTGLGLPLCRRLATLLGGEVWVESEPGRGASFFARIPVHYGGLAMVELPQPQAADETPADGQWALVIEDEASTRLLYEKYLKDSPFPAVGVSRLAAAREMLKVRRPAAVILDILLPGEEEETWRWLSEVKSQDDALPVIVVSTTGDARKAYSLGADAYFDKPVHRDELLEALARLAGHTLDRPTALIIDDDETARYVIRRSLRRPMKFEEAGDGASGLDLASRVRPGVIFLDLAMPGMSGDEVLDRLASDPATAKIPVVVVTSRDLDDALRERLSGRASAILQKRDISIESLARTLDAIEGRVVH